MEPLIPLHIIGLFLLVGLAVILGLREKRHRQAKWDGDAYLEVAAYTPFT